MTDTNEIEFQEKCRRVVSQEVYSCVSGLVHTLARGYGEQHINDLSDLCEEAFELCRPSPTADDKEEVLRFEDKVVFEVTEDTTVEQVPWLQNEDAEDSPAVPDEGFYVYDTVTADCSVGPCDTREDAIDEAIETHRLEDEANDAAGEIFEHWIVSNWLARKLEEHGETVGPLDNLTVWGRRTTGQAICMDHVIREIVRELHR